MDQVTKPDQRKAVPAPRRQWRALIVGTVAIILGAHLFPLLHIAPPGLVENRVLATAPPIPTSLAQWSALPKELDSYVDDNFPPRAHMIAGLNYARYKLGYSGSTRIIVGREGWLFYDDGSHLALGIGRIRLDPASVQQWVIGLKQRVEYLSRRGIKLYATIGPVKEDLYPEYLPRWNPKLGNSNEADDLFNAAHAAGFTQVIDPRKEFRTARVRQELYDRFDTHWTAEGAYIGYRALMGRISQDFPDLKPLPFSTFNDLPRASKSNLPRNMSLMLGIDKLVPHDRTSLATDPIHAPNQTEFLSERKDWTAPQVLHTTARSGKTVLLLHDSFTLELLPLLKRHFTTIVFVHLQDGMWREDLIEKYHPDMVVMVVIQPGLRFLMNPVAGMDQR